MEKSLLNSYLIKAAFKTLILDKLALVFLVINQYLPAILVQRLLNYIR